MEEWFEFIDSLTDHERKRLLDYLSGYYAYGTMRKSKEFQKITMDFINGVREKETIAL